MCSRVNNMDSNLKCSCVTQLLECLNDWSLSFDNKIETDVIYLDFSKAFDTVAHQRLLYNSIIMVLMVILKSGFRTSYLIADRELFYEMVFQTGKML